MHPHRSLTRRGAIGAALAALLAAAAGCASQPDVRHDQDPSADLLAYRTFAFTEISGDHNSPYATLLASRLKQATRAQLERRHYALDDARPDLLVNLRLIVREKQEVRSRSYGWGRAAWRGWNAGEIETVDYRQGTLAIDLIDTRRSAVVWHGVAQGRLDAQAMEQPGPAIEAAVGEVFARFPGKEEK
jgi:hypothetical protein